MGAMLITSGPGKGRVVLDGAGCGLLAVLWAVWGATRE